MTPLQQLEQPVGNMPALPPWKRALDLLCCVVALPLFLLFALCVAVLMKLTSPGPIFFRQERIGYLGRRFQLLKFRTMHVGADTSAHKAHFTALVQGSAPMQKLDARGDARLIPGGWLLRAAGLDELPQIINVLRGEMSIVGPRPCIPYEYEQYTPRQRKRCRSVPGLTGLWQVSGKNRTTFDQMIQLDIAYAYYRSLWLDLKIIFLTIPALCRQMLDTRRERRRASRAESRQSCQHGTFIRPQARTSSTVQVPH
jgi:lipopolysaccharide/colanic/teichoic acid biosynthesis glycosyltransferase